MDLNPDSWSEDTDENDYYNFSNEKRGDCIIFNQENFDDPKVKDRCGSDMDTNKCQELFEYLRFQVQVCKDLTVAEIKDKIEQGKYINNSKVLCIIFSLYINWGLALVLHSTHSTQLEEIVEGCESSDCHAFLDLIDRLIESSDISNPGSLLTMDTFKFREHRLVVGDVLLIS
ncbi:unnamed protein product, partial [Meganyctiphanes norvegica]